MWWTFPRKVGIGKNKIGVWKNLEGIHPCTHNVKYVPHIVLDSQEDMILSCYRKKGGK